MKMKKLLFISLAAMLAVACSKSDDEATMVNCPEGTGIVSFGVAPSLEVEGTRAQVNLPEGTTVPVVGDFALQIFKNHIWNSKYNWRTINHNCHSAF